MARLTINGQTHNVDVEADTPLLWVLRDNVGLTGTKYGCGIAYCGACTVHLDGQATRSCSIAVGQVGEAWITTIEGIGTPAGRAVQAAWQKLDVVQCGYCQSGQVMAATALLATTPKPGPEDIQAAMTNICRCGTYNAVAQAIAIAGERL